MKNVPEYEARTLIFDPDDVNNTNIVDAKDGQLVYSIRTKRERPQDEPFTRYIDASGRVVGTCQWELVKSDKITIGDSGPMSYNSFMHRGLIPFVDRAYFKDKLKRKYKWAGHGAGLEFHLYREDDKVNPVALWKKIARDSEDGTPRASLTLDNRGMEIQDLVLISFCLMEKERRPAAASHWSVAEQYDTLSPGPITGYHPGETAYRKITPAPPQ
ncbi:hypothetical protein CC1G_05269 [Coprinopsis cinerea okayama7|uniref:DUF6593 domain-containing protein n=1 Tax=Coprinopsis cinerea (strain Okayama-7 / 130 / ATCC MYA-4618 / FGSC 9003) TaxID=240176 RepID=A8PCF4_COPC7|nr:hypothetical protein CC1G_05269 [Coprinopsis cinerea okayama7\|eukprot:XP_001840383.1 hypothetical protein CC1G_05269 [Coprinopsis cinerea okayama7\